MVRSRLARTLVATGLLVGNAVPLVGVLAFGWQLHSLLVVYWLENGVVGLAYVAKIRRAEGTDDPGETPLHLHRLIDGPRRAVLRYFLTHYGAFLFGHGIFVYAYLRMFPELQPATPGVVAPAAVGIVAYHAVSYRVNYVAGREYEHEAPVALTREPYGRMTVLHLTILIGGAAVAVLGAPAGAVAVMVVAKTALDLAAHLWEHEPAWERPHPSTTAE